MHCSPADGVNTSADYSRSSDTAKQTATVTEREDRLVKQQLCVSLYHSPTYCRTHSLTLHHTLLQQDTHLHGIIRLAAGDLASLTRPVCGMESESRALGWCSCAEQTPLLSVLMTSHSAPAAWPCHITATTAASLHPSSSPDPANVLMSLSGCSTPTCVYTLPPPTSWW